MANISQNVNIEMLEKLPDGTYKRKYPKTRSDTGVTFDEHLADTTKHVTIENRNAWNNTQVDLNNHIENKASKEVLGHVKIGETLELADGVVDIPTVVVPSDNVVITTNNYKRIWEWQEWTKAQEIKVGVTGVIRVSYEYAADNSGTVSSQLYLNDEPVGDIEQTSSKSTITVTQDISVIKGDFVQLYAKAASSGNEILVKNLTLSYDIEIKLDLGDLGEVTLR